MKTTLKTLIALLTLVAFTSTQAAVTGRSSDTSLAGTEKLLSDSSGADTFILLSTLWGTAQPLTAGITATGSTSWDFSGSTATFKTSTGINTFGGSSHVFAATLIPSANDGAALGSASASFSDLFLASGGVININNGYWTATHSAGVLTIGTNDDIRMTTSGTNAASVVTVGGTQTLTNKTLTSPTIEGATLTTPALGVATATSVNGLTITTSTGTLTITNGKTLAASNTLTFTGTDSTSFKFPATSATVFSSSLSTNDIAAANSLWGISNGLTFEGASADAHEITITPADATADVFYLLPDAAAGSYAVMSTTFATNAPDIANSVTGASNALVFEGATANGFEGTDTIADVTADRTYTRPDASGTYILAQASTTTALTADNQAVTPGSNNRIQLSSDNATASNRTFTLSATGAITGQIYILIGPASNACEIADTSIQKLSAAWSPGALDTLTLLFDGTNFIELARADN
jgi:hypothetical protein